MRRDGPPGRKRDGPRAVTSTPGDRSFATTTPPLNAGAAFSITPGPDRTRDLAALLGLSAERDRWERVALDWARSAYRRGFRDGHGDGYSAGFALAVRQWKITAGLLSGGPSFSEMDRRRYPPDGRQSWIIPRPGEAGGRDG